MPGGWLNARGWCEKCVDGELNKSANVWVHRKSLRAIYEVLSSEDVGRFLVNAEFKEGCLMSPWLLFIYLWMM